MKLNKPRYYALDPVELREDIRMRACDLIEDGHITQGDFADLAGLSHTTCTLWLRGVRELHSIDALSAAWTLVMALESNAYEVER